MPQPRVLIALFLVVLSTLLASGPANASPVAHHAQVLLAEPSPSRFTNAWNWLGDILKKKKKPRKPKPDPKCAGLDISQELPKGFEPSDSVYANGTLFVVSDDGQMLAMDKDGKVLGVVVIGDRRNHYDLEALTYVRDRPWMLYVGVEQPQMILEYDVRGRKLTGRQWDLSPYFKKLPKNAGMEALVYVKTNRSSLGGYFIAGCQHDARLFLFNIDLEATPATDPVLIAEITDHPGPNYDISAASIIRHQLYLLFDKAQTLIKIDLNDHEKALLPKTFPGAEPPKHPLVISAKNTSHTHYEFNVRGAEGFSISEEFVFVSIDYATSKQILRYTFKQFIDCFKTHDGNLTAVADF